MHSASQDGQPWSRNSRKDLSYANPIAPVDLVSA
jgi:hypothetical protein